MPPDVSLVLTAECTERGRGANGRLYVFGWAVTADAGDGQATDAAKNALTAWGTDLWSDLNAVALTPSVAKPGRQEYIGLTGAHHAARAAHSAEVIVYRCADNEWDTQRRRGF